jgi:hypothetical protein
MDEDTNLSKKNENKEIFKTSKDSLDMIDGSNGNNINLIRCPYSGCEKMYKLRENLNIHIQNKHINLKPYKCSYCDSSFSYRNGNFSIK